MVCQGTDLADRQSGLFQPGQEMTERLVYVTELNQEERVDEPGVAEAVTLAVAVQIAPNQNESLFLFLNLNVQPRKRRE